MQRFLEFYIERNVPPFEIGSDLFQVITLLFRVGQIFFSYQAKVFQMFTICHSQFQKAYKVMVL